MFQRFRNTVARFMMGRYGMDAFNKFLFVCYIVLALATMIVGRVAGGLAYLILYLLETALVFYLFFRMLSRNINARSRENAKFWSVRQKVMRYINLRKQMYHNRKTNVYRRCPNCKAMIKLPRKKGKHTVLCPKCRKEFGVRV